MLKHVQSTGGRSACSTPVMGKARHTRSPSCSAMGNGPSTLCGTSSLMRARRQSDIPTATHSRNSSTSSLLTSLAANLLSKASVSRRCSARWSMDCDCACCAEDKSRAGTSSSATASKHETDSVGPLTLSAASSYTSLNLVSSPNSSFDSASTSSSLSPGTSMVSSEK